MAKKNNLMIAKLIMFVVAGLGFLTFIMNFITAKNLDTALTGSNILEDIGKFGTESTAMAAYSVLQYVTLFAIIAFGILCVLAIASFVFEGLSVKLSKIVGIVAILLAIVAIICGYVCVGEMSGSIGGHSIGYSLAFGPWYLLIISAVHTLVAFFAFKK